MSVCESVELLIGQCLFLFLRVKFCFWSEFCVSVEYFTMIGVGVLSGNQRFQ